VGLDWDQPKIPQLKMADLEDLITQAKCDIIEADIVEENPIKFVIVAKKG
jgi:hypothetical protein